MNLRDTLAPTGGRGIWVDDRSLLSSTGQSKTYVFNVSASGSPFKVVGMVGRARLAVSSAQLVNDLDLEVTSPDETTYLGNVFSNGRSIRPGPETPSTTSKWCSSTRPSKAFGWSR